MRFKEEWKEIYKKMDADEKKTFRQAMQDEDYHTVNMLITRYVGTDAPKKKKSGRKNLGLTKEHAEEKNRYRREIKATPYAESFPPNIIEKVQGEIITEDSGEDAERFKELYKLTCYSVLEDFQRDNEDLVKRHPYTWYKKVLIRIKQQTPRVEREELDKLIAIWDVLKEFMADIGLYITYETFQNMANIYDYQLVKMAEVSPKYKDFRQRILYERDCALVDELQHNPFNQTNKIFIAKCHGIIEKTENRTVEVMHSIKKIDDIPIFGIEDQEKKG